MDRHRQEISRLWNSLRDELRGPAEDTVSSEEVALAMQRASVPTLSFFLMLALATSIATLGLLANSTPAIIGAMIIAPLMAPIMSLAFGIVDFDIRLTARSIFSVTAGIALVVGLAYLQTRLVGLRIAESEILDRTSPSLIDLGVAMAAGAAAAFAYSRRSIMNSIAGVAIAVALVPPLAVTGIGIAMGRSVTAGIGLSLGQHSGGADIATGAFTLFLTNLVGIVGVGIVVFITQRYGRWKQALVGLAVVGILAGTLIQPLNKTLSRLVIKSTTLKLIAELPQIQPELFEGQFRIDDIDVVFRDDQLHVYVRGIAPKDFILGDAAQTRINAFQRLLSDAVGEEVAVELALVPVDILLLQAGPRPIQPAEQTPSEATTNRPAKVAR